MRIGLVIYGDLAQQSGGYLYDRMLVAGLRRLGCQVVVVSLPAWAVPGLVQRKIQPAVPELDAILQDGLCFQDLWAANRGPPGCPTVALMHNLNGNDVVTRARERRFLRGVDGVVANSQHTSRQVEQLIGRRCPRVVAYPAADHLRPVPGDEVTPKEIVARSHRPVRLLTVANQTPAKGLSLLLVALATLRVWTWRLQVVGDLSRDPVFVAHCRALCRELGLEGRVSWTGELTGAALASAYRGSDVFVLPSPLEGFGIATLEAIGFGLPVIASAAGATAEIVTHGQEALLFAPGDATSLGAALERLLSDGDQRRTMACAALGRSQRFAPQNWTATARLVRRFLTRVVGCCGPPLPGKQRHR